MSICRDHCNNTNNEIIDQFPASEASNPVSVPPEITVKNADFMSANNDMHGNQDKVNNKSNMPPTGKSIAHKHFSAGEAVFLSFDVETGGNHCGIVQLFCQIFCIIPCTSLPDPPKIVTTKDNIYNKYIKPPQGAIWSQQALKIHGISPSVNCIQSTKAIGHPHYYGGHIW